MDGSLFSIVVITYNQEAIIQETLESTLGQDYWPLEIIICDDGSVDDTGKVCRQWIEEHGSCFQRAIYHRNPENIGILGNKLKGIGIAGGEFIKVLAGDDLLMPGAVRNAAGFFRENPEVAFLFGNIRYFGHHEKSGDWYYAEPRNTARRFFRLGAIEQFRILSSGNPVPAPGSFFRKRSIESLDPGKLNVRYVEDWTIWLLATSNGNRLAYDDFDVAYYRQKDVSKGKERDRLPNGAEDCLEIIDRIVWPNRRYLSAIERFAVRTNRLKLEKMAKGNRNTERFYGFWLTLSRFFIKIRLYCPLFRTRSVQR